MKKLKDLFRDEATAFVLKIVAVYGGWKLFHYLVHDSGGEAVPWWAVLVHRLGVFYASVTSPVLNFFGENTRHWDYYIIYNLSGRNIRVEEHCLAIPAMVIFTGAILLFPGKLKHKLWFIPLGLGGIFIINLLRLIFLSVTFEHFSADFFKINHTVIYVIATYSLIMLMIGWWMKKFSPQNIMDKT